MAIGTSVLLSWFDMDRTFGMTLKILSYRKSLMECTESPGRLLRDGAAQVSPIMRVHCLFCCLKTNLYVSYVVARIKFTLPTVLRNARFQKK